MSAKLKEKLIQIALGAIGSAVTAIVAAFAGGGAVEVTTATSVGGPIAAVVFPMVKNAVFG